MTDKIREEFEKFSGKNEDPLAFRIIDGDYIWSGVAAQWKTFQAAYNLREQEVQRLREALESLYNIAKFTHGKGATVGKHWLTLSLELMNAKQALQETTKG